MNYQWWSTESINKVNNSNVKYLSNGNEILSDEEAYSDDKHFTPLRAAKLLEEINESLKPENNFIITDRPKTISLTTPKIYSCVNSTYKFGCETCTRLGHGAETCTVLATDSINTTGGKRPASHGHSPEAKRM